MTIFHIYGDNVVECSRTLEYILQGFPSDDIKRTAKNFINVTTPSFYLEAEVDGNIKEYEFRFFPGTNSTRWNKDIYDEFVLKRGGILSEGADALLTKVEDGVEIPLLSIEFSAALPAGNNAWQRSGRALSLAQANIPYFYIVHIGGKELSSNGSVKAPRFTNPAVPLSFSLSTLKYDSRTMFVYSPAPEADEPVKQAFENCYGTGVFSNILYNVITGNEYEDELDILNQKNIEFTKIRSAMSRKAFFNDDDYDAILNDSNPYAKLIEITKQKKKKWKKTIANKIRNNLPPTLVDTIDTISDYSYSIVTTDLPICLVPKEMRAEFAEEICENIYQGKVSDDFKKWLYTEEDLVVCIINGFKPQGEDGRPDRGLLPLAKMLTDNEVLTIVYGTARPSVWGKLHLNPRALLEGNGLWKSILNFSEGIIVDSPTRINFTTNAYYKNHWASNMTVPSSLFTPEVIKPFPNSPGEHDVDSAIHLSFSYSSNAFECSCNPPGGDWSGISLVKEDCTYRWTSLKRVSGKGTKRPDHIYQINYEDTDTLLVIESKGTYQEIIATEKNVGTHMIEYLTRLFKNPSNAKRKLNRDWESCKDLININEYNLITAVAYRLTNNIEESLSDLAYLIQYANVELIFALEINNTFSKIHIFAANDLMYKLAEYLKNTFESSQLSFHIYK